MTTTREPEIPKDLNQLYANSKRCGAGSFSGDHISPLIERIARSETREKRLEDALRKYKGVRDGWGNYSADTALEDRNG